MVRKQVLVQLDDELLGLLDQAAQAEHTTRSELLRRIAKNYLFRRHRDLLWERDAAILATIDWDEYWNDDFAKGLVAEEPPPYAQ